MRPGGILLLAHLSRILVQMSDRRSTTVSIEYYADLLRPLFEGRKFILIGGPVVGFGEMLGQLRTLGAERPLIIGSTLGAGDPPSEEEAL
jgi:hypothetical protein